MRTAATVAVVVLAIGGCVAQTLAPRKSAVALTARADQRVHGSARELFHFDDLATMVATSSLVIDATVLRTGAGLTGEQGDDRETPTDAILKVESSMRGTVAGDTVTIEMLASVAGQSAVMDGLEPLHAGDRGVFFLRAALRPGVWVLVSSQGRYLDGTGDHVVGADQDDALIQRLSKLSRVDLEREIEDAKQAVDDGAASALPLPPSTHSAG